ncbi:MAG: hypothetical protein R3B45_00875 [Bdellovibrionota bacterium]
MIPINYDHAENEVVLTIADKFYCDHGLYSQRPHKLDRVKLASTLLNKHIASDKSDCEVEYFTTMALEQKKRLQEYYRNIPIRFFDTLLSTLLQRLTDLKQRKMLAFEGKASIESNEHLYLLAKNINVLEPQRQYDLIVKIVEFYSDLEIPSESYDLGDKLVIQDRSGRFNTSNSSLMSLKPSLKHWKSFQQESSPLENKEYKTAIFEDGWGVGALSVEPRDYSNSDFYSVSINFICGLIEEPQNLNFASHILDELGSWLEKSKVGSITNIDSLSVLCPYLPIVAAVLSTIDDCFPNTDIFRKLNMQSFLYGWNPLSIFVDQLTDEKAGNRLILDLSNFPYYTFITVRK